MIRRAFDTMVAAVASVWAWLQRRLTPAIQPTIGEMLRRLDNRTDRRP